GRIHLVGSTQPLWLELLGRAGGLMVAGARGAWEGQRPADDLSQDIAIAGWLYPPTDGDVTRLRKISDAGGYIVSLGRADTPAFEQVKALSDVWLDTTPYLEALP